MAMIVKQGESYCVTFTKYYQGDQIKEYGTEGIFSSAGGVRNEYHLCLFTSLYWCVFSSSVLACCRSQQPRGLKTWTVFARSNTENVGWNPTPDMDVCLFLFCVCVLGSGLAAGWSLVQRVLPAEVKRVSRMSYAQKGGGGNRERVLACNLYMTLCWVSP
jgi:hypothetical protein